ncbi:MAG: hypothetical protein Q9219_004897 [cf. Caloplaca sp. 3 TL-2023]
MSTPRQHHQTSRPHYKPSPSSETSSKYRWILDFHYSPNHGLMMQQLLANAESFFPSLMQTLSCAWSPKTHHPCERLATPRPPHRILAQRPRTKWAVNKPAARILGFDDEKLSLIRAGNLASPTLFTDR